MKKELGTGFETSFNYKITLRNIPEDLTSWSPLWDTWNLAK